MATSQPAFADPPAGPIVTPPVGPPIGIGTLPYPLSCLGSLITILTSTGDSGLRSSFDDFYGDGEPLSAAHSSGGIKHLSGEANNDTIIGRPGNDHLWGGLGDDTLSGLGGNDGLACGEEQLIGGDADPADGGADTGWQTDCETVSNVS